MTTTQVPTTLVAYRNKAQSLFESGLYTEREVLADVVAEQMTDTEKLAMFPLLWRRYVSTAVSDLNSPPMVAAKGKQNAIKNPGVHPNYSHWDTVTFRWGLEQDVLWKDLTISDCQVMWDFQDNLRKHHQKARDWIGKMEAMMVEHKVTKAGKLPKAAQQELYDEYEAL